MPRFAIAAADNRRERTVGTPELSGGFLCLRCTRFGVIKAELVGNDVAIDECVDDVNFSHQNLYYITTSLLRVRQP